MDIRNLGNFASIQAVWQTHPNGGIEGDYLFIPNEQGVKYRWNKYIRQWENAAVVTETPARQSFTVSDLHVQNEVHVASHADVQGDLRVQGVLRAAHVKQPNVGLFATLEALQAAYPSPEVGMWATVGDSVPGYVYRCNTAGTWEATGETGGVDDLENVVLYGEQSLTDAQKKQARQNLGFGDGDFATGSDFDDPDSTKRAKIPTVGAIVDGLDADGAYDVTARSGGTTFDSLDDLLGSESLGTLIPVAKRRGGMSIKFVLTESNTYVQCRYMLPYNNTTAGNNAFKNVENWQVVDEVPTAGSDNLVESGGVYNAINLCNIPEVNDFVVDIVFKEGVDDSQNEKYIDFSLYDQVVISDLYLYSNTYRVTLRLRNISNSQYLDLYSEQYSDKSDAEALYGILLESDYCYVVLRHVEDGQRKPRGTLTFNKPSTWKNLNEHPAIKELLIEREVDAHETEIDNLQEVVNAVSSTLVPITLSGAVEAYSNIWRDEDNPIPQNSLIENNSGFAIYAYDSYSTAAGEYNYVSIPAGGSWISEYPVYRIQSANAGGNYSIKTYYPDNVIVQVQNIDKRVNTSIASLNNSVDAITNTLYGGSTSLPTVVSSNKYPPRTDGSQVRSSSFKNYTVDLTGAYSDGYRKVRFYGFSHNAYSPIIQGLVATGVEDGAWIVESYIRPASFQAGYCELPITANSTLLVGCILTDYGRTYFADKYPEGTDLNFVPTTVQLLNEEATGVVVKISELNRRVTDLEEGGSSADAKFPATYMPKKVYGVIGDTLQIFRRSVVVSNEPYKQYLNFTCGQGKVYERYFEITPEKVNGVVPANLTIRHCLIADDFRKSEEQTSNLVLADRPSSSPASNINVLCIGASTTAGGLWPSELKRRLTGSRGNGTPAADGLTNIFFVGRKELAASTDRPVPVNIEATGGWRWHTFYTPQTAFRFYVSGVTSVTPGANYNYLNSNNETVVVTVAEVNITGDSGNIRFTYNPNFSKRGAPASASGTLTKRSDSGDATIAYSSFEEETYCPFYDEQTEQPDFAHYASLYCNNQIDVLVAYMGNANEHILGDSTDESITQVVNNMKTLLDAFHADFPNAKVIIGAAAPANAWYGCEYNYGAASPLNTWSMRYGLYRYTKAVETFLQGNDYKDWCFFAGTNTEVDSENGYPTATKPANTRTSRLDVIGTNGAHPTLEGYQQVADSFYRCFVNTIL